MRHPTAEDMVPIYALMEKLEDVNTELSVAVRDLRRKCGAPPTAKLIADVPCWGASDGKPLNAADD